MLVRLPTVSNVGGVAREKRMRNGVFAFSAGLVLAVSLVKLGVPQAARAVVLAPFFFGVMAMLQGLTGS